MKRYQMGGILLLSIGAMSGCVNVRLGNGEGSVSIGSTDGAVEMEMVNGTQDPVRVWANWEDVGNGTLSRGCRQLGQLQGRATGRYTIPYRWRGVSLAAGPLIASAAAPQAPGPCPKDALPRGQAIEIGPGDQLQWVVEGTGEGRYFVRLTAHYIPPRL